MTKIVSFFNQAGGVGKTTLTMNIGYHLAEQGQKVLLVDIDSQATLTIFMGLEPTELEETVYQGIMDYGDLPIHKDRHGMDLVPANSGLGKAEQELVTADMRDMRLKYALEPLLDSYDYVLIDCPPSPGILSYISLVASSHILIPIQTQYKALKGSEALFETIKRVRRRPNPKLKLGGAIPSMHDKRTSHAKEGLESIEEAFVQELKSFMYPPVPHSVIFQDASREHLPVALHSSSHKVVKVLREIAKQVEKNLNVD